MDNQWTTANKKGLRFAPKAFEILGAGDGNRTRDRLITNQSKTDFN
ncbi:MAG: hypothetical protein ACXVNF_09995 [Neobacillus sp.]